MHMKYLPLMADTIFCLNKYTLPFLSQMDCGVPFPQSPVTLIFFLSLALHLKASMSHVVTKVLISLERQKLFGRIIYLT